MKPGTVISHYKILGELGRGGMGVVYRAEDTKLDRQVALKLLSAHMLGSESDRSRFYREARAAAGLQHPNIATVYEIDESDGQVFIALEFVEGRSLDQVIEDGPLPLDRLIQVGIQIADGLTQAHEQGVVHRDIKSGNVMLTSRGVAKVMDFGLAKTAASTKLTQYGSTLGTIAYMSPEQARGEEVDRRADLWSLGVVLYEMISGKMPFPGDYEQAVIYGILNDEPKPLTSIRTGVPMELEQIVDKCLRKDASLRYQHADEIASDLKAVGLGKTTRSVAPSAGPGSDDHPTSETRRARQAWIWALPLALIAGILIGRMIPSQPDNRQFPVRSIVRVTSEEGLELNPAISPDGTMIAYVSGPVGNTELFVKKVDGGNRISVASGEKGFVAGPGWSPDGSRIVFRKGGSIFMVPALGGTPEPLVLGSEDGSVYYGSAAWSPVGDQIAVTSHDSLFLVEVTSRNRRLLATMTDDPYNIAWSPDGSKIAGSIGNRWWSNVNESFANAADSRIWIVDVKSGLLEEVESVSNQDDSPVFDREGTGLYVLSRSGAVMDLFHVDLDQGRSTPPQRLTVGLDAHTIKVDGSRSRFAYSKVNLRRNVWRVHLQSGRIVSTREAEQVTVGAQVVEALDVSPDGTKLVYDSNVRGTQDIYMMTLGQPYPVELTADKANDFVSTWVDNRRVLFYSLRRGDRDIYMLDTETRQVELVMDTDGQVQHPNLSRDGRRLAFRAYGQGVADGIYLCDRTDEGTWGPPRLLAQNLEVPRWSPTADILAVDGIDGLALIDPESGATRVLVPPEELVTEHARWTADGSSLIFSARQADNWGIWSVPKAGGRPLQLLKYDEPDRQRGFHYISVHDDYVYFTLKEAEADIWLMNVDTH